MYLCVYVRGHTRTYMHACVRVCVHMCESTYHLSTYLHKMNEQEHLMVAVESLDTQRLSLVVLYMMENGLQDHLHVCVDSIQIIYRTKIQSDFRASGKGSSEDAVQLVIYLCLRLI